MAGASFGELAGFAADPLEEGVVEAVEGGLVAVVLQAFGVELEAEGGGEFVEVDAWPAFAGEFVRDSWWASVGVHMSMSSRSLRSVSVSFAGAHSLTTLGVREFWFWFWFWLKVTRESRVTSSSVTCDWSCPVVSVALRRLRALRWRASSLDFSTVALLFCRSR